jgi:cytochrome c5
VSQHDKSFFTTLLAVMGFLVALAVVFYFIAQSVVNGKDPDAENAQLAQVTEENIKPVGSVVVAGESGSAAAAAGPRSGADVYNGMCLACHATGAAGAPKVGDKAAWEPRTKKGLDGLLTTATEGLNAMPPKGTCADCSADELKAAIVHMLAETGIEVAGAEAAAPAAPPAAATAGNGKQVYDSACMACHATGAAGAPKLGDKAAWEPRIAQGVDTLVQHSISGIRAMPPRGACATCSDDDIKAAVDYMVSESK